MLGATVPEAASGKTAIRCLVNTMPADRRSSLRVACRQENATLVDAAPTGALAPAMCRESGWRAWSCESHQMRPSS